MRVSVVIAAYNAQGYIADFATLKATAAASDVMAS